MRLRLMTAFALAMTVGCSDDKENAGTRTPTEMGQGGTAGASGESGSGLVGTSGESGRGDSAGAAGLAGTSASNGQGQGGMAGVGGGTGPINVAGASSENRAPKATTFSVSARVGASRTIQLAGFDPDGDALTYRIESMPSNGTLSGSGASWIYTPESGFLGEDSFTYIVSDGRVDAEYGGYVWITVYDAAHNDPPQAADTIYYTEPNTPLDLVLDIHDADGDSLQVTLLTQPSHGTLTGAGAQWKYAPAAGWQGSETISVRVEDGKASADASLTICVAPKPVFGEMTVDRRYETMTQMSAKRTELGTLRTLSEMRALESYARTLPGVAFVGSNESGVFGQFTDGVQFIYGADPLIGSTSTDTASGAIAGAPNAGTSAGASAADASATGLVASAMKAVPNGRKAVLFTGFGSDPLFPKDPTPDLAAMLSNAGYDVEKRDATVSAFEIASSDHVNVVHLRTHGGAGIVFNPLGNVDGKKWSAWTLTPASKENIQLYEADLKRGLLAIMDERVSASRHEEHFGITANFIGTRWSLESGAYVHASSCYLGAYGEYTPASGNPPGHANTDLQAAIFENDAMLFAGWTKATEVTMLDQNARYTFDRLLGANVETPKESPPQRPMGAGGLVKDLETRHLALNHVDVGDGAWTSVFRFVTRAARGGRLDVDRLAPSIAQVRVDTANNQLIVMGELDPYYVPDLNQYRVNVSGQSLPVTKIADGAFYTELPALAAGDVYVEAQGRKSNRVRLSSWRGKLTYTISGPGDLTQEWIYNVSLLGDVHQYRDQAGTAPQTHESYVTMLADGSSASYRASGSSQDTEYRVEWSGSGSLNPKVVADTSCEQCFAFFGKTTPEAPKKLWWNIMPSVSEANRPHEKIYQRKNDEWVQIVDRQVPITFPLDRSGIADVSDFDTGMFALMLPATIAEDGTIEAGDTQAMDMSFIGAGNVTGWTFRHQLKWAAMSPSMGTEIDAQMPR